MPRRCVSVTETTDAPATGASPSASTTRTLADRALGTTRRADSVRWRWIVSLAVAVARPGTRAVAATSRPSMSSGRSRRTTGFASAIDASWRYLRGVIPRSMSRTGEAWKTTVPSPSRRPSSATTSMDAAVAPSAVAGAEAGGGALAGASAGGDELRAAGRSGRAARVGYAKGAAAGGFGAEGAGPLSMRRCDCHRRAARATRAMPAPAHRYAGRRRALRPPGAPRSSGSFGASSIAWPDTQVLHALSAREVRLPPRAGRD